MILITLRIGDDPRPRNFALGAITIGRSPSSQIVLNERRVSRMHARIEQVEDEIRLVDLNSGNGTRLNGQKVESQSLMVGDTLLIGPTPLTILRLRSAVTASSTAEETKPASDPAPAASAAPASGRTRRPRRRFRPSLADPGKTMLIPRADFGCAVSRE